MKTLLQLIVIVFIGYVLWFAWSSGAFSFHLTTGAETPAETQQTSESPTGGSGGTGVANPASVDCLNRSGTVEIRNEANGQVGYCHLPDGRVCEEWALFRDKTCTAPAS